MKSNISQARINQQIRNMIKQPLSYLKAVPLQNDIYTWHFTIQGPQGSDFHEGLYHGHILLPYQYPFKPPDIVFLNKNGRFQTNTKICLTITQYHPEEWNSAWTIRTMLQAVISLFNQNVQGVGYQEGSPQQRQSLAKKSHNFKCDKCGLLKDVLKPRQPIKKEQKKQEQKINSNQMQQTTQKLQYASQLNLRKVHTQDNRYFVPRNSTKLENKQRLFEQKQKTNNKKNIDSKQQKQQINPKIYQKIKIAFPDNDVIALDRKVNKNYITWARVIASQKWSVVQ